MVAGPAIPISNALKFEWILLVDTSDESRISLTVKS